MNHVPSEKDVAALIRQLTPDQIREALKHINQLQETQSEDVEK